MQNLGKFNVTQDKDVFQSETDHVTPQPLLQLNDDLQYDRYFLLMSVQMVTVIYRYLIRKVAVKIKDVKAIQRA